MVRRVPWPRARRRTASSARGFGITLGVLGVFMAVTLSAELPASVTGAWLQRHSRTYLTVWPQGWFFFDNTADSPVTNAYPVRPDGTVAGSTAELAMSRADGWGLGRVSQGQLDQTLELAARIPAAGWVRCGEPLSRGCLAGVHPYHLVGDGRTTALCGLIAFVRTPPVRVSRKPVPARDRPGTVALAQVSCT